MVLDASHETDGIVEEVEAVLRHPSAGLRALIIHDSAMPSCRKGLESIRWEDHPSVRSVTLDFLPGCENEAGEMGGGMALAWVLSDAPTPP